MPWAICCRLQCSRIVKLLSTHLGDRAGGAWGHPQTGRWGSRPPKSWAGCGRSNIYLGYQAFQLGRVTLHSAEAPHHNWPHAPNTSTWEGTCARSWLGAMRAGRRLQVFAKTSGDRGRKVLQACLSTCQLASISASFAAAAASAHRVRHAHGIDRRSQQVVVR
jgi:hypothetical protein